MSTTYELVGRQLKSYLLTANKPLHDEIFATFPTDLKVANVKANDHSTGIADGTFMGDVSSVQNNFIANGITWTPAGLATVTGVKSITNLAELEAITDNAIAKDGSGQLYVVVKGTVSAQTVQAAIEAVTGRTFSEPAKEIAFVASGPTLGIHGEVTLAGAALAGTAKVYKVGDSTSAPAVLKAAPGVSEPTTSPAPAPKEK